MVNASDFEVRSLYCGVISLDKKLCSTLSLFTPGVKMGTSDIQLGEPCYRQTSYPGGSSNVPSCFMVQKPP